MIVQVGCVSRNVRSVFYWSCKMTGRFSSNGSVLGMDRTFSTSLIQVTPETPASRTPNASARSLDLWKESSPSRSIHEVQLPVKDGCIVTQP